MASVPSQANLITIARSRAQALLHLKSSPDDSNMQLRLRTASRPKGSEVSLIPWGPPYPSCIGSSSLLEIAGVGILPSGDEAKKKVLLAKLLGQVMILSFD